MLDLNMIVKKLIGVLLLLSFLMAKYNTLAGSVASKTVFTKSQSDPGQTEDASSNEKESEKSLSFFDEMYHDPLIGLVGPVFSVKINIPIAVGRLSEYHSSPDLPPEVVL